MIGWRKRLGAGAVLAVITVAVLTLSAWAGMAVVSHAKHPAPAVPVTRAGVVVAIKRPVLVHATAASVPVLVYHEMNNGCADTAPICKAKDPETVSTTQFRNEMAYLLAAGYRTISLAQYEAWLRDPYILLPRKPILLTADNGIGSFLEGAQPILERDGFTMTAFLVSGFAYGASGVCEPDLTVAGVRYEVQPGCGSSNKGWDLTWAQLRALSPRAWSFALEAGRSGHFVQVYDPKCQMFDACKIPGETTAAYEARVRSENTAGLDALSAELPGRVNRDAWVVPYSDLGYHRCAQSDCTPQNSTGAAGWLARYAASRFAAVFVEDAFRNSVEGERFRMDINGSYSESYFEQLLGAFTTAGDFSRGRAAVRPPSPPPVAVPAAPAQLTPVASATIIQPPPPATTPPVPAASPSRKPSPRPSRSARPSPSPSPVSSPSLTPTPTPSPSGSGS